MPFYLSSSYRAVKQPIFFYFGVFYVFYIMEGSGDIESSGEQYS